MAPSRRPRAQVRRWAGLPDEELLEWRFSDLGLELEGCDVEPRLARLDAELSRRGLRFRPYTWLSTDWFTPDGATGFAVPFYLAHRRLARLERSQMLQEVARHLPRNEEVVKRYREVCESIDNDEEREQALAAMERDRED